MTNEEENELISGETYVRKIIQTKDSLIQDLKEEVAFWKETNENGTFDKVLQARVDGLTAEVTGLKHDSESLRSENGVYKEQERILRMQYGVELSCIAEELNAKIRYGQQQTERLEQCQATIKQLAGTLKKIVNYHPDFSVLAVKPFAKEALSLPLVKEIMEGK